MKNKNNIAKRFHAAIRTKHVFIEDEQVFLKKETQETFLEDTNVAEWFPTDFKWEPVRL
ncbi:hypothetical protein [Maribacter sp. 2308TA10-17]|uniref:hypothetical protein n=1 Tax=Maribacter sp. 2308TA10-17 TaxID=3386276 RepID=UPI0039BCD18E